MAPGMAFIALIGPWLYWLYHVIQLIKIWSTVALAGERFISVLYPFKVLTICSKHNLIKFLTALTLASLVSMVPRLLEAEHVYKDENNSIISKVGTGCGNYSLIEKPGPCTRNVMCTMKIGFHPFIWYWYPLLIDSAFKFVIPYALLMVFNGGIIYKLSRNYGIEKRKMREEKLRLGAANERRTPESNRAKQRQATRRMSVNNMCLALLLSFFICRSVIERRHKSITEQPYKYKPTQVS